MRKCGYEMMKGFSKNNYLAPNKSYMKTKKYFLFIALTFLLLQANAADSKKNFGFEKTQH